ncbi:TonB C-terminal domain-containing protein [Cystobacter ferrugineus]|uniref:TonB C-terminal domain-containing protein n=1 Tax=Cystobacter ferrugineus TaxID=83449 RepID=UPI001160F380|nr:TonB C-terminal domain-containing protein [Cystobacter ferrugineus]
MPTHPPPVSQPPPVKEKKATRPRAESAPPKPVAAAESPPPPPAPLAGPEADSPLAEAAPEEAPPRPNLLPSWSVLAPGPGAPAGVPESRGRTLRPGDPELRPESKEEEGEKLTARVQDWIDDDTAGVRAGGIGGHPYFGQMRGSLEGGLAHTDGGKPEQLGVTNPVAGLMKNYTEAAREFGRTGTPGGAPPPSAPLQSERLTALFGNDPKGAHKIRAMAQARESLEALASRGALFTVKLEVRHARSGALLDARIAEHSGNELFDAFVLKVVPGALGDLAPPPATVIRDKKDLRTQWLVEGWHHASKGLMESIGSSLLSGQLAVSPLLLMKDEKSLQSSFEYRARLLKVY